MFAYLALVGSLPALGGVPDLEALFPAGGRQGTQFVVNAVGKLDPWPVRVWVDDDAVTFTPGQTNGQFQVAIASGAVPGPHLVRVFTPEGASAPRLFVVGIEPERTVEPPGPALGAATPAPPAAAVAAVSTNITQGLTATDGALELTPVPVTFNAHFSTAEGPTTLPVEVGPDQVLRARFIGRALDSPAQGTLVLLNVDGVPLVTTRDESGRDAELRCPLPRGGRFRLEVRPAVNCPVDGTAVYRLQVSSDPLVPVGKPLNLTAASENVVAFRPMTAARTLVIPGQTRGVISPEGRQIYYSFEARVNEEFRFVAKAGSVGSPLSPLLRVLDLERRVLAESLSAPDAELVWLARQSGEHLLAVTDAQGQGGPIFSFLLEVEKPTAHFSAELERDAFRLKRGGSCECVVRVIRPATSEALLHVSAIGLPAGVSANPVHAPPGVDEVRLVLTAAADAPPANVPFRVLLMTTTEAPPRSEFARFTLRPKHASLGELLRQDGDQPWLTVTP